MTPDYCQSGEIPLPWDEVAVEPEVHYNTNLYHLPVPLKHPSKLSNSEVYSLASHLAFSSCAEAELPFEFWRVETPPKALQEGSAEITGGFSPSLVHEEGEEGSPRDTLRGFASRMTSPFSESSIRVPGSSDDIQARPLVLATSYPTSPVVVQNGGRESVEHRNAELSSSNRGEELPHADDQSKSSFVMTVILLY